MRHLLLAAVCVWVAALTAAPATHAMNVKVTYSVAPNSGSFLGPFSSGLINGGNVSLGFPNAVSLFSAPKGSATLLALTLTGPSGYFRLLQPLTGAYGKITQSYEYIAFGTPSFSYPFASALTGMTKQTHAYLPITKATGAGGAFVGNPRSTGAFVLMGSMSHYAFVHLFGVGAEISRVPEPASASLVLLGLVGLATVSGARRFLLRK